MDDADLKERQEFEVEAIKVSFEFVPVVYSCACSKHGVDDMLFCTRL